MYLKALLIAAALLLISICSYATHIRAAELTYQRISDEFFTYEFTLTGYTDTGSPVRFGDGIIDFGDGRNVQIDLEAVSFEDGIFLGKNDEIEIYRIKIIHTYVTPGWYRVSYLEPNRNDEIVNINKGNSVQTPFYIESSLLVDPLIGTNSSPVFLNPPIDRGFIGKIFSHNPWALDADGDSLVYRRVIPLQDQDQVVPNFELPNDGDFYLPPPGVSFGNEQGSGPAEFQINQFTGDLVWDAPGNLLQNSVGPFSEYVVTFLVEEWRNVEGSWQKIGHVQRDMQIIVNGDQISRPDFEPPPNTLVTTSETISETITFADQESDQIKVEYFGEVFFLENSPMTASQGAGEFTDGPISLTFDWTPLSEHGRARPYYVHLKLTDLPQDPDHYPSVTYKTWVLYFDKFNDLDQEFPDVITNTTDVVIDQKLEIYPNPAKEVLNLQIPEGIELAHLKIINSLGQQTIFTDLSSNEVRELDIRDLPAGLYFVHLNSPNGFRQAKFVKQ